MPQYELCYILAAQVSDDQVPAVTEEIKGYIEKFEGTNIIENHLGKKKLAYQIKKTKNGYYVVVRFSMPSTKVPELEAKIRTNNDIIRHLVIKLDEHLKRLEKDREAQAKLTSNRQTPEDEQEAEKNAVENTNPEKKVALEPEPEKSDASLDDQIEAALSADDIIN